MQTIVTGLKEVQDGLSNIESGLKDTSDLVEDIGHTIEGQAKINASGRPGPNVRTGNLRASGYTQLNSPVEAITGFGASYAPDVEFGHRIISRFTRFVPKLTSEEAWNRMAAKFAPAYPFFFNAVEQCRDKINQLIGNFLSKLWGGK